MIHYSDEEHLPSSELQQLYLYSNSLSGSIPKELGLLKHLWVLQLLDNRLTGPISTCIGKLVELSDLRLHQKQPFWINSNHNWKFDQAYHFNFVLERTKWFCSTRNE